MLNDLAGKVEQHNSELVALLLEKDELGQEQESVLMDIGDLTH